MRFERTKVMNFEGALRGMRNPLESWVKSDSKRSEDGEYRIGENDLRLAQTLIKGGSEHRKFLRQIFVTVDITAPLYWWKEFDTYAVGVTKNSTSTMHKIASKKITKKSFEIDDVDSPQEMYIMECLADLCESLRLEYLSAKDQGDTEQAKSLWKTLIRVLPESWLQMRTVTMNYENVYSMIRQRLHHKLNEWSGKENPENQNFIRWAKSLPYANELLFIGLEK